MPLYKTEVISKSGFGKIRGRTSFPYIYYAFMDIVYTVPTKNARAKKNLILLPYGSDSIVIPKETEYICGGIAKNKFKKFQNRC